MNTTQDTMQQKPAQTAAGGCCMPARKPQADEPAGKPVEVAKEPSLEVAGKKIESSASKGGGCGCGS